MTRQFTVLWDNDGVLVNTEKLYFQATAQTMKKVGIIITQDIFTEYSLTRGQSLLDLAADKGFSNEEIEQLRQERNNIYAKLLQQSPCTIAGARETLQTLHEQVRMGLVTSSRRDHFDIIHRKSGIISYFDFVLTRHDYTHTKPHPAPYLTAMKQNSLTPDGCVVVEDSERGLASAYAAGLRCIIIKTALTKKCSFHNAYKVLGSIYDTVSEIQQLARDYAQKNLTQYAENDRIMHKGDSL